MSPVLSPYARECPIQSNGYDCGVHVLANALYQVTGTEAPLAHDCALWRRICIAILSGRVNEIPEDTTPLDMSSYSVNLIWKKPASLGTGHHEAIEKGFNALQWERRRNREDSMTQEQERTWRATDRIQCNGPDSNLPAATPWTDPVSNPPYHLDPSPS